MPRSVINVPDNAIQTHHWKDIQPALDAGGEFKFVNFVQGWYCETANILINCHTYDLLKRSYLIKDGKKWSPQMHDELRTRVANEAAKNQAKRLEFWFEQINLAMQGQDPRKDVREIIQTLWSEAGAVSITDPMD